MSCNITIIKKDISQIGEIKDLWEELNKLHLEKSVNFKDKYESFKFKERFAPLLNKKSDTKFNLDVVFDSENNKNIGYCLSSISGNSGEIESLFLKKECRGLGLGSKLFKSAKDFFAQNNIDNINIMVVYNNENALPFYEKQGFFISTYTLTNKHK